MNDAEKLHQLTALLDSMGVSWSVMVRAALSAMDQRSAAERMAHLMAEFRARAGPADARLANEQELAAQLLRSTPLDDPLRKELMEMVLAFAEQREGMRAISAYFDDGDAAHLEEATLKVQQGMERARQAAVRAARKSS